MRFAIYGQASSVVAHSKELQMALANLSSHSEQIVCNTCGHYIPLTDAQLVVDAAVNCSKFQPHEPGTISLSTSNLA